MTEHLNTIYKYFPKDIHPSDLNYINTPECKLQWELIENSRNNDHLFLEMCHHLTDKLNFKSFQDMSLQGIFDLSGKAVFYLPDTSEMGYPCCIINVIIIAPLYAVYFSAFSGGANNTLNKTPVEAKHQSLIDGSIALIINDYFPNYKPFPMDFYSEEIPGIRSAKRYNKYATYFECLLTDESI